MFDKRLFKECLDASGKKTLMFKIKLNEADFEEFITESDLSAELLASEEVKRINFSVLSKKLEKLEETLKSPVHFMITSDRELIIHRFANLFNLNIKAKNSQLRDDFGSVIEFCWDRAVPNYDDWAKKLLSNLFQPPFEDYFDIIILQDGFLFCDEHATLAYPINEPPFEAMTKRIRDICIEMGKDYPIELDRSSSRKNHKKPKVKLLDELIITKLDVDNQKVRLINREVLETKGFLSKEMLGEQLFNQTYIKKHNADILSRKALIADGKNDIIIDLDWLIEELDPYWIVHCRSSNRYSYTRRLFKSKGKLILNEEVLLALLRDRVQSYRNLVSKASYNKVATINKLYPIPDDLKRKLTDILEELLTE